MLDASADPEHVPVGMADVHLPHAPRRVERRLRHFDALGQAEVVDGVHVGKVIVVAVAAAEPRIG